MHATHSSTFLSVAGAGSKTFRTFIQGITFRSGGGLRALMAVASFNNRARVLQVHVIVIVFEELPCDLLLLSRLVIQRAAYKSFLHRIAPTAFSFAHPGRLCP